MQPLADVALVQALERHSGRAWPAAEIVRLNGWELRLTPGSRSRRVNSLTPIDPVPGQFAETLALARVLCGQHGLTCTVRLNPLAGEEPYRILTEMGHSEADTTSVRVVALDGTAPPPSDVTLAEATTQDWLSGMAAAGAETDERAVIARLIQAVAMPQAFAIRRDANGKAVSFGRAAAADGVAGLFHIATAPDQRGHGHAGAIVAALLAWCTAQGARKAYLQVVAANAPALAVYDRFGFREAYRYAYVTL